MKAFLKQESASGFVLIGAALLGMVWANSPFAHEYHDLLHAKVGLSSAAYGLNLTVHEWVNDGLMAVFFFLIGLEIKREVLVGELSSLRKAALPAIAAAGGMILPAIICVAFIWHDPALIKGWAIPAATDIAFALAVLALAGSGLPPALKVFLTALAVIDDLGAILIIAVFYTPNLSVAALLVAGFVLVVMIVLNRLRVVAPWPYVLLTFVLWFCVFESGIHATLAGVAAALTIPMASLRRMEHALHPYVAFLVVPLFGLFNAGVSFAGMSFAVLLQPLPLGVALGLFAGKQIGIFGSAWLASKFGIERPSGVTWAMTYGVALLGGIGFTMALFIGSLAYDSQELLDQTKIGVFAGSLLAALGGYFVLRAAARRAVPVDS